ncbi:hypothetical protein P154DRAFT_498312 [Amniculicola lignicola CBS 123094]|uniref:RRN7-type domain-containing protein n=1 Tax=Amniculicola lignicola CBS 123094 TaxID=1392246 RepID=A0A6A5WG77_9PLEO|nr:hypothetical protein P154DRAFT_498312 [Amniculicola lignicola CBS 123094]
MNRARGKGPICGIENCRSRRYDEGEDGYLYCENGHRKGDLVIGQDEDDYTDAARDRTRKKKKEDGLEKFSKYYKGPSALDLHLKSLQLILRHQVWFLVHDKGLPAELEQVVFDLWTLRILKFETRLEDNGANGSRSQSQTFSTSQSEAESEDELSRTMPRDGKLKAVPNLIDSLALCYLGIITLRLPVTPGDIYQWVTDGKLAYRRAIKYVPLPMRDRLPATYHAVLDPNTNLTLERFYDTVSTSANGLEKEHGIVWPALNVPLLLFRCIKELALPLELYDSTMWLGKYLNYDFTLHAVHTISFGVRRLPEAQLMACLVVCVKLMYPFDDQIRSPRTASEPAAAVIDWEEWHRHISSTETKSRQGYDQYTSQELLEQDENGVFTMSKDQLDQYLDFYQDSFLDEARIEKETENRKELYEMFPINFQNGSKPPLSDRSTVGDQERLDTIKAVHGSFKPQRVIKDEDADQRDIRPGQLYKLYRKEDDLPISAKRFYTEIGKLAGLDMEMLVNAVFFTEKKMAKWRNEQRKERRNERG